MRITKLILFWIIGLMFIATGFLKFMHFDTMSAVIFDRARYPSWLFYGVAAFELIGGILFIIRKTRQVGVLMIGSVMLGAIWTHYYLKDDVAHLIAPTAIILIAVSSILKYKKK
ncbi:MAG TPA: DoxX family protein [Cytophagaceae bacterium]|jgi:putative oxidoreductase|nr:DoxX family protein [Cytophagaceae bacterium]